MERRRQKKAVKQMVDGKAKELTLRLVVCTPWERKEGRRKERTIAA